MRADRHKTPPKAVRMPPDLLEWFGEYARGNAMSMNAAMVKALAEFRYRRTRPADAIELPDHPRRPYPKEVILLLLREFEAAAADGGTEREAERLRAAVAIRDRLRALADERDAGRVSIEEYIREEERAADRFAQMAREVLKARWFLSFRCTRSARRNGDSGGVT